ncbi:MAG: hypothetical protein M0Z91_13495 [Actinomycetota bacterium]|nr:hypothetical protein [Actinomycetota bacterium]
MSELPLELESFDCWSLLGWLASWVVEVTEVVEVVDVVDVVVAQLPLAVPAVVVVPSSSWSHSVEVDS